MSEKGLWVRVRPFVPTFLIALGLGILTYVVTLFLPPVWEARTVIAINSPGGATGNPALDAMRRSPVEENAAILRSAETLSAISESEGIPLHIARQRVGLQVDAPAGTVAIVTNDESKDAAIERLEVLLAAFKANSDELYNDFQSQRFAFVEQRLNDIRQEEEETIARLAQLALEEGALPSVGALQSTDLVEQLTAATAEAASLEAQLQERASIGQDLLAQLEVGFANTPATAELLQELRAAERRVTSLEETEGPLSPDLRAAQIELEAAREVFEEAAANEASGILQGLDPESQSIAGRLAAARTREATIRENLTRVASNTPQATALASELEASAAEKVALVQSMSASIASEASSVTAWAILDEPYIVTPPINRRPGRNAAVAVALVLGFAFLRRLFSFEPSAAEAA